MNRIEYSKMARYLDKFAPLVGASHNEVLDYSVSVPFFYAELCARLANGRTTRLSDPGKFLGWLGYGPNPILLFDCDGQRVVVNTGNNFDQTQDTFIARNGGLIPLHA